MKLSTTRPGTSRGAPACLHGQHTPPPTAIKNTLGASGFIGIYRDLPGTTGSRIVGVGGDLQEAVHGVVLTERVIGVGELQLKVPRGLTPDPPGIKLGSGGDQVGINWDPLKRVYHMGLAPKSGSKMVSNMDPKWIPKWIPKWSPRRPEGGSWEGPGRSKSRIVGVGATWILTSRIVVVVASQNGSPNGFQIADSSRGCLPKWFPRWTLKSRIVVVVASQNGSPKGSSNRG